MVRPLLNNLLHGLGDKMTDEAITEFLTRTRSLLYYIQFGGEADDGYVSGGELDHDGYSQ